MNRKFKILFLILIFMHLNLVPGFGQGRGGGSRIGSAGAAGSRGGGSRPNVSQLPSRPNTGGAASRPAASRPNGGLTPSTRPAITPGNISRPATPSLPGNLTRPNTPSLPGNSTRPSTPSLPGNITRPTTPSLPGNITRPTTPSLPGNITRPTTPSLPGNITRPTTPSLPGNITRPSTPSLPGNITRPSTPSLPGNVTRPVNPIARPDISLPNRPNITTPPNITGRPSPGDLGDFLGINRPLQPGGSGVTTLPARPGDINLDRPVTLPGLSDRPVTLPGLANRPNLPERPNIGTRPGINDRPNFTDRGDWTRNTVINSRPSWVNIDRSVNINVNNRWNNAFVAPARAGWWNRPPARTAFWAGWGLGVRSGWRHAQRHNWWFTGSWWGAHRFPVCGWHFHFWNHNYPASYWWGVPTWARVTTWFVWTAPGPVWAQPVYYDYGSGGNVTYVNNTVYVGGESVATAEEFAATAMELATVDPPASDEQAASTEWLPLGTFAVSTSEKDVEPSLVVQLAVTKNGIVSGTLYNIETDQSQAVQGQVDKNTQRVAFRLGESETVTAETGLYNLTQDEAPVLVHFGTDKTENYLLVRLQYDENGDDSSTGDALAP